ncbi:MAG: hypothetical protein IPF92_31045 [Myxococcales bacterium]|jgi:hypothetical protein|nr:hypothetical protein [Myxococcales bacterium]MBL0195979.1 hypothetical protein [Myxococcales bacterium]
MTSTGSGMNIVVCGGGVYATHAEALLSTRCGDGDPVVQFHDTGFRCVK